jgi:hypothetical protein
MKLTLHDPRGSSALAESFVCELATDLQDQDDPVEVQSLGGTLAH